MRRFFTTDDAAARGISKSALRWGEGVGKWRRAGRGVYAEGPEEPTTLDRAVGVVVATGGAATGQVAGALLGLDSVEVSGPDVGVPTGSSASRVGVRRRDLDESRIVCVDGIRCTDGLQTLLDLAQDMDDVTWEQVLESALRKRLTTVDALADATAAVRGASRIRQVLAIRPAGALPQKVPRATARRLAALAEQARRRPLAS